MVIQKHPPLSCAARQAFISSILDRFLPPSPPAGGGNAGSKPKG